MATLTVHPQHDGAPFLAWRDGVPTLTLAQRTHAAELIADGDQLGLTPEGPHYPPGWRDQAQAAAMLLVICYPCSVVGDPSLHPLMGRGNAV